MSRFTPVPGVGIKLSETLKNFQDLGKARNKMPKETRKGRMLHSDVDLTV